jgi:hypothetical protein
MDLCLEHTTSTGAAPVSVTTRDLAEKLVSLYWTHVTPFPGQAGAITLRQNAGTQAAIVSAVAQFRARHAPDRATTPGQARTAAPAEYERLVRGLEWTLVEMPLYRACK